MTGGEYMYEKASVIIPTHNKEKRLYLTLLALYAQTYSRHNFEVIVVDDGSIDNTSDMVNQINVNYELRYIYQENQGRSSARNMGARQAKYPLLLFVDDDCLLEPNYIEENCYQNDGTFIGHNAIYDLPFLKFIKDPLTGEYFEQFKANKNTTDFVKKVCLSEKIVQTGQFEGLKSRLSQYEKYVMEILNNKSAFNKLSWLTCTGASISMPATIFEEIGGFDEEIGKMWGCEDFELGYRTLQVGYPHTLIESTKLYHMTHFRQNPDILIAKAMDYILKKHGDPLIQLVKDEFFIKKSSLEVLQQLKNVSNI